MPYTAIDSPVLAKVAIAKRRGSRGGIFPALRPSLDAAPAPICATLKQAPERTASSRASPLDGEIFHSLREAKVVVESWRRHDNTVRPHGSLGCKPPAPEAFVPALTARA